MFDHLEPCKGDTWTHSPSDDLQIIPPKSLLASQSEQAIIESMKSLSGFLLMAFLLTNALAANPVLQIANDYADGGGYNKEWKGSGTPEPIVFDGKTILAKGTNGTYCSGFTFTVAMKTAAQQGLLRGKTVDQIRKFQKEWYGVPDHAKEKQCLIAAENLGIGTAVKLDDAQPGDFMQFWRTNGSGHSAIFMGWVEQDGKKTAVKYRSSQGSTGGIANTSEKTSLGGGRVNLERIYLVRLKSP